ncbi:MAG TPA: nitroreductase family protein [Thermodesulfobacteriota bacterium]|nr:nitroreductase family protein [Thermodesulfobacteriota bacterium]
MMKELVFKNRSYRRFHEEFVVDEETLKGLVDLARLSASSANLQPLKYILSFDQVTNSRVFPSLSWAGYLKDWPGPREGERPSAYIIVLGDTGITGSFGCDHGIAAQSILLGAVERGLGGCVISSIDRDGLRGSIGIPERFDILLVIALGKPKETVKIETVGPDGDVRYWRDYDGTHHVPKRSLEEILLKPDIED